MNNEWVLYLLIGILLMYSLILSILHIRLTINYDELMYEHSQYEYAEHVWNNEIYVNTNKKGEE